MIKGHCFTNLDDYRRENWPEKFVAVPRVGDRIQAKSGVTLRVVDITHLVVDIRGDNDWSHIIGSEPRIKIELHR